MAYEMRIGGWSSDGCSSGRRGGEAAHRAAVDGVERGDRARLAPFGDFLRLGGQDFGKLVHGRRSIGSSLQARRRNLRLSLSTDGGWRLPLLLRLLAMTMVRVTRSEEHTSELQSLMRISYAVFCLK